VNRFFVMLAAVSLSTAALADQARTINSLVERVPNGAAFPDPQMLPKTQKAKPRPTPAAPSKEGRKAPLMVSFTELEWIELPERKGMQFSVLSGDARKGA
jgi:hypothetical protein